MKRLINKRLAGLLVCSILILCATVGGTLAYVFMKTPTVENTFEPARVSCAVVETFTNNVKTNVRVENTGERPMPFCIGAHTAFRCPIREGESFEDYEIVFDQPEEAERLCLTPQGLIGHGQRQPFLNGEDRFTLNHGLFARVDTVILENLRSKGICLRHKESGRGVRMEFEGFPMLAFWTKGAEKAPFICLEPWHGCAALDNESGEFRDKPRCITLDPGGVIDLQYNIFVE
jgi:galactose mutarotase-like enzyme